MAKIKKVVIEAGGKEFNLTVEEAKALRDILNVTFEDKTTYIPYNPSPIIIERYRQPWGPWITWCNNTGDTVYCSAGNGASLTSGNSTTVQGGLMEARLITFRKLKGLCGEKCIDKDTFYCWHGLLKGNHNELKCTAKNCPVWKGLKEMK